MPQQAGSGEFSPLGRSNEVRRAARSERRAPHRAMRCPQARSRTPATGSRRRRGGCWKVVGRWIACSSSRWRPVAGRTGSYGTRCAHARWQSDRALRSASVPAAASGPTRSRPCSVLQRFPIRKGISRSARCLRVAITLGQLGIGPAAAAGTLPKGRDRLLVCRAWAHWVVVPRQVGLVGRCCTGLMNESNESQPLPAAKRLLMSGAVTWYPLHMKALSRITLDPLVMGGKPCVRGLRVTVGAIVGMLAAGHSRTAILEAYPYLEDEDLREALAYAAWRSEEIEVPLAG